MIRLVAFTMVCALACSAGAAPLQDLTGRVWLKPPVGQAIPSDLPLTDCDGRAVTLGHFRGRPVLLALVSYRCVNLCPQMLLHLVQGLNGIGPTAGVDFDVVTVSIDPRETVADARNSRIDCLRAYRRTAGVNWHAMVGSAAAIRRLDQAVGLQCVWDDQHAEFAQAMGVLVITPTGRIAHCFTGTDFAPADLAAALIDARQERITPTPDAPQVYCATYDLAATSVGRTVIRWLRIGSIVMLALLLGYIARSLMTERKRTAPFAREVCR